MEVTAEQAALLAAVEGAGIKDTAAVTTLQTEAAAGREALKNARTEAETAAVAKFGNNQPEKLTAAKDVIASTHTIAGLNMLTEGWQTGAPGSGNTVNEDGSRRRSTRSAAPSARAEPKTEATAPATPATPDSGAGANGGNEYAQYNVSRTGRSR